MATQIIFMSNNRPLRNGLEVTIQWEGYNSWNPMGGGHTKLRTDGGGSITIDENLFKGQQRKTDNVYIENPRGGHSRKFPGVVIKKGAVLRLHLEDSE